MKLPGQPEEGEPEDHEAPSKGTNHCLCLLQVGREGLLLARGRPDTSCKVMPIRGPTKNFEVNPVFQACMLVP